MATEATPYNGGPKTQEGKLVSSRNATTHGLTAKRWLNEDEQACYDQYLEAFTADFDPQTNIEQSMVAQLAECKTRLTRTHNVEDSLYQLARDQAESPEQVVASFQMNDPAVNNELMGFLRREIIGMPQKQRDWELNIELSRALLSKVSGWNYVREHLPALRHYILDQCEQEQTDIASYIAHETEAESSQPIQIKIVAWTPDGEPAEPTKTRDELEESASKLTSKQLTSFIEKRLKVVTRDTTLLGLVRGFDGRTELLKQTALPNTNQLGLIQRYRIADERQFSKTLTELIALQKHRRDIHP